MSRYAREDAAGWSSSAVIHGEGTRVSDQVFRSGSDTVFPLQAALGYEIAQTLFVAPDNLLVEGPADLIYLTILDEAVRAAGGEGLDRRWVIVPVGGVDKIATFVTLLGGNQLNTSVLIDVSAKDQQRIDNLQKNGYPGRNSLVHIGEITGATETDIEAVARRPTRPRLPLCPSSVVEVARPAVASALSKVLSRSTGLGTVANPFSG